MYLLYSEQPYIESKSRTQIVISNHQKLLIEFDTEQGSGFPTENLTQR